MIRSARLLRPSEVRALRGLIKAAPAVFPYPAHGTLESAMTRAEREAEEAMRAGLAERMAIEVARQAVERAPKPDLQLAAAHLKTSDRAGAGLEQAPEGTSGGAAASLGTPANACSPAQSITKSRAKAGVEAVSQEHASRVLAVESVSRPAAGRTAAATVELMTVTAGETAPDANEESADDFAARVAALSERRARILAKPEPVDWNRVADAHARKASQARPVQSLRPLQPADSPEECRRCGIPGRKGCAHQAAYVAQPIASSPYSSEKRRYG